MGMIVLILMMDMTVYVSIGLLWGHNVSKYVSAGTIATIMRHSVLVTKMAAIASYIETLNRSVKCPTNVSVATRSLRNQ